VSLDSAARAIITNNAHWSLMGTDHSTSQNGSPHRLLEVICFYETFAPLLFCSSLFATEMSIHGLSSCSHLNGD
jgi:hypothetical protein